MGCLCQNKDRANIEENINIKDPGAEDNKLFEEEKPLDNPKEANKELDKKEAKDDETIKTDVV